MKCNNENQVTEEKVNRVTEILKLGKVKHYGTNILMKCPFCRAKEHSFFVNMLTGEYCCSNCETSGNFANFDIELLGYSLKVRTNDLYKEFRKPNLKSYSFVFHFVNKNIDDILSIARFTPSIISVRNDNDKDFEFLYFFENLEKSSPQYKVIALRLLYDFEKLMSNKRITENEYQQNYYPVYGTNTFYKVIDHYSDSQLNSLIALFGNRLNND